MGSNDEKGADGEGQRMESNGAIRRVQALKTKRKNNLPDTQSHAFTKTFCEVD